MIILISLIIGFALGCLVNYAVTIHSGQGRNIAYCMAGALIGGAVIPWILGVPTAWAAIIGSVIGVAIVLLIALRVSLSKS